MGQVFTREQAETALMVRRLDRRIGVLSSRLVKARKAVTDIEAEIERLKLLLKKKRGTQ